jgi:hypothetical protein
MQAAKGARVWSHSKRWLCQLVLAAGVSLAIVLLGSSIAKQQGSHEEFNSITSCKQPARLEGGDCAAIGVPRRPAWACKGAMQAALHGFHLIYRNRPIQKNSGGTLFDHAFALHFILSVVRPSAVIESGAFNGQTTWLIRQTLPDAKIISLDPRPHQREIEGARFLTGSNFTDFSNVDWAGTYDIDPATTLIFFDDHQCAMRRLRKAAQQGFKHVMFDDNYRMLNGDHVSLKWTCNVERPTNWNGVVPDNFAQVKLKQTWGEHIANGVELKAMAKAYLEFPPVLSSALSRQTRYPPKKVAKPIIEDMKHFQYYYERYAPDEFQMYTSIGYVELS